MIKRSHREWFRPVSAGRKSCPSCHAKLGPGESPWSWGEYVYGKWRTVQHFCRECWPPIAVRLVAHPIACHPPCEIELAAYGSAKLPEWLTIEVKRA